MPTTGRSESSERWTQELYPRKIPPREGLVQSPENLVQHIGKTGERGGTDQTVTCVRSIGSARKWRKREDGTRTLHNGLSYYMGRKKVSRAGQRGHNRVSHRP